MFPVKSEPTEVKLEQGLEAMKEEKLEELEIPVFGRIPVVVAGFNERGNKFCTHAFDKTVYHYQNSNGSMFYCNPDRSTFYWDPIQGYSRYTTPDKKEFTILNPQPEQLSRLCFQCDGSHI
ncbi:hypothetical protein D9613_007599 [Agrocybe pediades]|uniref:Uncharacterized protein n=1 Tax=Agrocybe pediades TaxID=84607 RepID=A0A8H4QMA7_9AGAR|nr:hypothetical protein D9613_007599 [Agrocybe pediades]KAF9565344.1 hypothetical protein CPC08DRAFT_704623 [Agrocybe pediades]